MSIINFYYLSFKYKPSFAPYQRNSVFQCRSDNYCINIAFPIINWILLFRKIKSIRIYSNNKCGVKEGDFTIWKLLLLLSFIILISMLSLLCFYLHIWKFQKFSNLCPILQCKPGLVQPINYRNGVFFFTRKKKAGKIYTNQRWAHMMSIAP